MMKDIFLQTYEHFELKQAIQYAGFEFYVLYSHFNVFVLGIEDAEHLHCCDGGSIEIEVLYDVDSDQILVNRSIVSIADLNALLKHILSIAMVTSTRCNKQY